MALDMSGLFVNPALVREKRLEGIAQQQQSLAGIGGSMSGLLGQVAGGGNIMGQVLAEGIARSAGLKTQEEAQAEKAQSIFKNLNQSSAESVMSASKELADLGLTKASFAMAQQGMKLQEEATKKAREQAQQDAAVKWLNSKELPELAQGVAGGFIPASKAVEQALKGRDTKVVGNSLVDTESGEVPKYWEESVRALRTEGSIVPWFLWPAALSPKSRATMKYTYLRIILPSSLNNAKAAERNLRSFLPKQVLLLSAW